MRGAMATLRTRDEVARLFGGLKMIEPGVVQPQQWRPGPATETPAEVTAWCGVALKS
jgi:alkyl hydroperoxide reductase subunit AhpC